MKSERINRWLASAVALLFGVSVIGYTIKLTYDVMVTLFPNDPILRYVAIALYDGGVIAWLLTYIARAKGTPQRGISLLMTVLDFLGVVAMVIAGIYMGGQTLANIPAWVGGLIVVTTIIASTVNAGAIYYYHAHEPDVMEQIQAQELEDSLSEEALLQARHHVEMRAQALGAIMANRVTARLKYRMRLPMTEQEVREWQSEVVDAQAYDVQALPYHKEPGFWEYLRNFLSRKPSGESSDSTQSENSTISQKSEPEQDTPPQS